MDSTKDNTKDYTKDIRDFLAGRRARNTPREADLPAYGGTDACPDVPATDAARP
ncbi:hypothetical protein ACIA8E_34375 [Streptomyces sp. NPDC051664]|uniref:hypothetical protein n=1 Tax=Streptomyces sp. NPDC051664 TaxID=3365668 RepID=UPI00378D8D73